MSEHGFDNLMVRVDMVASEQSIKKAFPILDRYEEFSLPVDDFDKVMRYIVYCYDMNSPFLRVESLTNRKAQAAKEAGFDYNHKKGFDENVVRMLDGKNVNVNRMIIRYCRMQQSRLYSLIVSGNEAFYEAISKLQSKSGNADDVLKDTVTKMQIFEKAKANARELDKMSIELLAGDDNARLNKTLYVIVENNDIPIPLTPEDFALIDG